MERENRGTQTVAVLLCGLLLSTGAGGAMAQSRSAVAMENSLLGVRLLQSYRVVLQKYGQPTRVYAFDQPCGLDYALNSRGLPTGGIKNVYDLGGAGGGTGPSLAASSGSPYGVVSGGGPRMGMGMGMPASGGLPTFPTG
ncbi:MAG: hypothetical protein NZ557_05140, partial [Chthonomonadaceae bacterium]|nr:hypothetical protein [Chthonomonadaceae bacterium]